MHKNRIELEGFLGHKPEARVLPSGVESDTVNPSPFGYR